MIFDMQVYFFTFFHIRFKMAAVYISRERLNKLTITNIGKVIFVVVKAT